jgi:hypothetical protein
MTLMNCEAFRQSLEPYVDGELSGTEMLRVSDHLALCRRCAAEADALSNLGHLLRDAARQDPAPLLPEGLASGVIARVGAEAAQSWRALVARAVDGWHWAAVGAGSVAATFISAVAVGAALWMGQTPERTDSLAGLMANLQGSPGSLWVEATRSGIDTQPGLFLVDSGVRGSGGRDVRVVPASLRLGDDTEADLVFKLLGVLDRGGMDLREMTEADRQYAESLLDRIGDLRSRAMAEGRSGHLMVYRLHLVASTSVSAKALTP